MRTEVKKRSNIFSLAAFVSFLFTLLAAPIHAQDALRVKAAFDMYAFFGDLTMEVRDQDYECEFQGDTFGLGLASWSSDGPMYTAYKNNNWRAFFQNVTSFHIQGLAAAGGAVQVNFFRSDGTPVGQYNGPALGAGGVQAGGDGEWKCTPLPPPPGSVALPRGPAPVIGEWANISNPSRGMCLNLRDRFAYDRGKADVFECTKHTDQDWIIEKIGDDDFYRIRNRSWNMCLNLRKGNARKGGVVDVNKCVRHPDQEWSFNRKEGGGYQIWNRGHQLCLNLQHRDNGGFPNIWTCADHPDQIWSVAFSEIR